MRLMLTRIPTSGNVRIRLQRRPVELAVHPARGAGAVALRSQTEQRRQRGAGGQRSGDDDRHAEGVA